VTPILPPPAENFDDVWYSARLQNRFQNQAWYIKLWRLRWYLLIPFYAFVYRFMFTWTDISTGEKDYNTFGEAWALGVSRAQEKMLWFYTLKELDIYLNLDVKATSTTRPSEKK